MPKRAPIYPSFTLVVTERLIKSNHVCHSRATYGEHRSSHHLPTPDPLMRTIDRRWQTSKAPPPSPPSVNDQDASHIQPTLHPVDDDDISEISDICLDDTTGQVQRRRSVNPLFSKMGILQFISLFRQLKLTRGNNSH